MNTIRVQTDRMERPSSVRAQSQALGTSGDASDTPAERRKRKVRDAIIEAAEDVFAEDGEAGLSMRRLADRIDYSPAAIYKYFASKDELLGAIREQFYERLLARMSESGVDQADDLARFRAGLIAYIRSGLDNANHYRMAFSSFDPKPPAEGTRAYEAIVTFMGMIKQLIADGVFREGDPELASLSVWASCHGLTNLMTSIPDFPRSMDEGRSHVTRDALIEFHVEQMLRGLTRAAG
jgi:AcrR family transcriptional regulator